MHIFCEPISILKAFFPQNILAIYIYVLAKKLGCGVYCAVQLTKTQCKAGADPGFSLGGGAPLQNGITDW